MGDFTSVSFAHLPIPSLEFCPYFGDLISCQVIGGLVPSVTGYHSTRVTLVCSLFLSVWPLLVGGSVASGQGSWQESLPVSHTLGDVTMQPLLWGLTHMLPGSWVQNPRAQNHRTHSSPLGPEESLSNLAENFNMLPAFPRALASLLNRSPLWFNVLDLG